MTSAPTSVPTFSPTSDFSDLTSIFVMLICFIISLLFFCMCFFLSHSKHVAATHKIQKDNFVNKMISILNKNNIPYEPPKGYKSKLDN